VPCVAWGRNPSYKHVFLYRTRAQVIKMYEKGGVNIPTIPPPGCCPKLYEVIRAMLNPDPTKRMTVDVAFLKLTNLVPLMEEPGDIITNSPRYGLTPTMRTEREKRVDYIYTMFALTVGPRDGCNLNEFVVCTRI
jgi:hypothetical protein